MRTVATSSPWKNLCLLVSISSSPLSSFAHETLMLDNQCCHCSSSSSTRRRCACSRSWRMIAGRRLMFWMCIFILWPPFIFRAPPFLDGINLCPVLANEHGCTTRIQRHDHFLHYFHISTFCTGNITIHIDIIKYLGSNYVWFYSHYFTTIF